MSIRKPNRRHDLALVEYEAGAICTVSGKVRFVDEASAARAMRAIGRRDPEADLLEVYRCKWCRDHHFGHVRLAPR